MQKTIEQNIADIENRLIELNQAPGINGGQIKSLNNDLQYYYRVSATPVSFKPMFKFGRNEIVGNNQCFATEHEAHASALDRFSKWSQPTGFRIHTSEEPVNYKRVDGKDTPI
jgi:hypothetical protein